jgi:hypothetical protein
MRLRRVHKPDMSLRVVASIMQCPSGQCATLNTCRSIDVKASLDIQYSVLTLVVHKSTGLAGGR